jgi:atypical dual specificity phosphatase
LRSATCDFGFVTDEAVRSVLTEYHAQAVSSHDAGSYLGAVVGCGAVAEGLLTWLLSGRESDARAAKAAYKYNDRPIENWSLESLVKVAQEIGAVEYDVGLLTEAVRNWRNLVHPYRRVRGSPRFDRALSLSAIRAIERLVDTLAGHAPMTDTTGEEMNFGWFMERKVAGCRGPASLSELQYLAGQVRALVRIAKETLVTRELVKTAGLLDCHIEVKDFEAPTRRQLDGVMAFMEDNLARGRAVAVSCGAGYGRTGTVLACFLIRTGMSDEEALKYLHASRPESYREIVDNPRTGQLDAIRGYAKRLTRSVIA